jgi:hypothetical protein
MTEFNVSNYMFPEIHGTSSIDDVAEWLGENVGTWDKEVRGLTAPVVRKGVGWEIQSIKTSSTSKEFANTIKWVALIEDDQKAMLFALKWVK